MKRNLILLLTLCHSTLLIYSQNTTNSPTSMFGLGELSTGEADNTPDWVEQELPCKATTS